MKKQIFISYRRDGGESTAQIIRDRLVNRGYNVFYDIESLKSGHFDSKLYEKIEECLDFIIILSPHSLDRCVNDGDWVRCEIVHAIQNKKNIIPILTRGFTFPDNMPDDIKELVHMNGVSFENMEFLEARVDKIASMLISKPSRSATAKEDQPAYLPALKRAFMFLEDGEFDKANDYLEQVLNQDPECGEAYIGKIMINRNCRQFSQLNELGEPFDTDPNYKNAMRFSSLERRIELENINQHIKYGMLENAYLLAVKALEAAVTADDFANAALMFAPIADYKDAKERMAFCSKQSELLKKTALYKKAVDLQSKGKWHKAIEAFSSILGFEDSDIRLAICKKEHAALLAAQKQKRDKENYAKAVELQSCEAWEEAVELFSKLHGYQDSDQRLAVCQRHAEELYIARARLAKRKKTVKSFLTAVVICALFIAILIPTVIMPGIAYSKAVDLMNSGRYEEAIVEFHELDKPDMVRECYNLLAEPKFNAAVSFISQEKYEEAIESLESLINDPHIYNSDYEERIPGEIERCRNLIERRIYDDAIALMNEGSYDEAILKLQEIQALGFYGEYYAQCEDKIAECTAAAIRQKYDHAVALMNEGDYDAAVELFSSLGQYENAAEQILNCKYLFATSLMEHGQYEDAIAAFTEIKSFKDSETQILACQYKQAVAWMEVGSYADAMVIFKEIDGYEDSHARYNDCRDKLYREAGALLEAGNYVAAYDIYESLNGYIDSQAKMTELHEQYPEECYSVGHYITLGSYMSSADGETKGPISWQVLAKEDNKVLLLSEKVLDCLQYNDKYDNSWESCTLRQWLNSTFIETAFNEEEQARLVETTLISNGGAVTTSDRVFILDQAERDLYLRPYKYHNNGYGGTISSGTLKNATSYAWAQGVKKSTDSRYGPPWWMRPNSLGENGYKAREDGGTGPTGYPTDKDVGVCPAIWITRE